jgi:hypothetical protein
VSEQTPAQLRAAATLLRQRAEGTTPAEGEPYGRYGWAGVGANDDRDAMLYGGPMEDGYRTGVVFEFRAGCPRCCPPSLEDVGWMETVHPGVAEPLAAWLEHVAEVWTFCKRSERKHALAVARALLGGGRS